MTESEAQRHKENNEYNFFLCSFCNLSKAGNAEISFSFINNEISSIPNN